MPDTSINQLLLERAIFEHVRLPLRSDRHQQYLSFYVDAGNLDRLRSKEWQVIFGRRGTGKTLLLGALHDSLRAEIGSDTGRNLPLSFTGYEFRASPIGIEVPEKIRGLAYFQIFMESLATQLSDAVESLTHTSWNQKLLGVHSRRIERVEKLAAEIVGHSQSGAPLSAYSEFERSHKSTEVFKDQSSFDLSIAATSDVRQPLRLGAGVTADKRSGSERRSVYEEVQSSPAIPRFIEARNKMVKLLDELQLSTLYILIDEWSALDATATTSIQPLFSELLKISFGGSDRIAIKIAANPHQVRFSNLTRRHYGLELGADIFVAANLDYSKMAQHEQLKFYESLLRKRLLVNEPSLDVRDAVATMFDEDAYRELVNGSEGVPRRFLQIFNSLAEYYDYRVVPPWGIDAVRDAITGTLVADIEVNFQSSASPLRVQLQDMATRARSRIFYVRKEDAAQLSDSIEELLEARLIHDIPHADVPPRIRLAFDAYRIDYGLWLYWVQGTGQTPRIDESLQFSDDPETVWGQTLHASQADSADLITCANCDAQFSRSERPYKIRGLCPNCYRDPRLAGAAGVSTPDQPE
ncbi:hypothetical protein QA942_23130 [Streptomyces sp. B21-106]|uniref:hypothetical protein n=1 Tax=Streptomyces sp. B21-106 TaxID=3039418 RepID=UPI002FF0EA8B